MFPKVAKEPALARIRMFFWLWGGGLEGWRGAWIDCFVKLEKLGEKKNMVPAFNFFFFGGYPRKGGWGVRKKCAQKSIPGPQNLKFP